MANYTALDLFSGLGGFSAAFRESDRWDVTTVEIDPEFSPDICADIFTLRPSDFETDYDVVLASPPCQFLNTAGNHDKWDFDAREPCAPESRDAVALFHHTIGLIHGLAPEYWYVENPNKSRIRFNFRPPDEWVAYCQYGKDYQKQTGLWGDHAPMKFRKCSGAAPCHVRNAADDGREAVASMNEGGPAERAKVPYELSEQIRRACERALEGSAPTQASVADF